MASVATETSRRAGQNGADTSRPSGPIVAPSGAAIDDLTFEQLFPTLPGTLSLAGAFGKSSRRGLYALHRQGLRYFSDIARWRVGDLKRVPGIGIHTAADMVTALADEAAHPDGSGATNERHITANDPGLAGLQRTWTMWTAASTVAAWAVAFVDPGMTLSRAMEAAAAADDLPPPEPEQSPGGDSEDIGDEIQRIIASYSRARTQND